jgi:hypothetical protein
MLLVSVSTIVLRIMEFHNKFENAGGWGKDWKEEGFREETKRKL